MHLRGTIPFTAGLPLLLCLAVPALPCSPPAAAPARPAAPLGDPAPRRVTFQTDDAKTLAATYCGPRDLKQEAPAVLLVHGAGESRADLQQLAARLQKSGFATLTLDLRGHGESATAELDWKKLDAEAQKAAWIAMAADVKAGIGWLLEQPGVQHKSISLIGHGAGCALVARHAKRDERVRCVVLLSPVTEQLGASLGKDLVELSDLPMLIGAGEDETQAAKRIEEDANKGKGKDAKLELELAKVGASELLTDAKFTTSVARWLKSRAQPEAMAPEAKPIH